MPGAAPEVAGPPALKAPSQPVPPVVRHGTDGLPAPVIEMREAILAAVRSGSLEELRVAIELNEIKPVIGDGPAGDPIAYLKAASADGDGREILAALGNLLAAGYAILPLGRDLENNRIYVWPYFALTGVNGLTPAQEAELTALVPAALVQEMREKAQGRYTYWRVGIAADGTWHVMSR